MPERNAATDAATDPHAGKGSSELGLLHTLGAARFPDHITAREVQVDGQFLVTTLVNRKVRRSELDRLYAQRWMQVLTQGN